MDSFSTAHQQYIRREEKRWLRWYMANVYQDHRPYLRAAPAMVAPPVRHVNARVRQPVSRLPEHEAELHELIAEQALDMTSWNASLSPARNTGTCHDQVDDQAWLEYVAALSLEIWGD